MFFLVVLHLVTVPVQTLGNTSLKRTCICLWVIT